MPKKIDLRTYYNGKPKFSWAEDMADFEYVQPSYLIKPIIPPATWGILYGHPETGKTQLALSMAAGIIEGSNFLSRFSCRKGKVGLIEVDTESPTMTERLGFIQRIHSLGERQFGIAHYDSAIDILKLEKAAEKDPEVLDWLKPMRENRFDLIIIDSLNKVHNMDESSNTTPKQVYGAFRRILGSGPTFLFIHHARKGSADWRYDHTKDDHDYRGTAALKADTNFMFKLIKDDKSERRTLQILKAKGAPPSVKKPFNLMFHPETLLFQPDDPIFARAFALVDVGFKRKEVVKKLVEEGLCEKTKAYKVFDEVDEIFEEVTDG